jgi:tetratricopeptide (TPR) repeat protein
MDRFVGANYSRLAPWILTLLSLLALPVLRGQSTQNPAEPVMAAILHGVVLDSRGHPVADATVCLQAVDAGNVTVHTDAAGAYRFLAVRPGTYTLRVEMVGHSSATLGSFSLAQNESRTIDVTLESAKTSEPQDSSAGRPEFFDEPHFTVAGVTDTTNLGSHGSNTIAGNRDALAKATASLGKQPSDATALSVSNARREKSLREEVERQPADFDANYQLGKLLVDEGKAGDAFGYLERASQLNPRDYDNTYELALARTATGDYEGARAEIQALLTAARESGQEKAEPHHLLGEVCEKLGDPLEAVREYQRSAELNPSEPYLFDWGSELLLHRAAEPALEVFTKGNRLFPRSSRMLAGLGASWYALGSFDQAAQRLCEASDLNPNDPTPYLLMGKMQAVEASSSDAIMERLARFVRLQPENALANYYYAVSLWKRRPPPEDSRNFAQVKTFLEKAIQSDPMLGLAYLQLGILYSERKSLSNAVAAYQRAIGATPELEEAHYRLAQAYRQQGETSKAQAELQIYERISNEKAAKVERQRHEVQQFVYELREAKTPAKPK